MKHMTVITPGARARAGAPEQFTAVVKALYGQDADAAQVWSDVFKASPDQADLNAHARTDRRRRAVTAGLSAVGATAGAAGLGYAGYKTGQAYRTAKAPTRMRRLGQAVRHEKLGAALVPLEIAGLGGEIMATKILHGDTRRTVTAKALVPTDRVAKLSMGGLGTKIPHLGKVTTGVRQGWLKAAGRAPMSGPSVPKPSPVGARHAAPVGAAIPGQATLPGMNFAAVPTTRALKQRALGRDVGRALGTRTGKVMAGTIAAGGTAAGVGAVNRRRSGMEYADDSYLYGKADTVEVEFAGTFSKLDDAKHLAFGWASVTKVNGSPVVDKQDDYIDLNDLEEAAYNYVRGSRVGGNMHKRTPDDRVHQVSDMVESMVFTPEKISKMGLPDDFPQGWWVGYKIHDPATWDEVASGRKTGFSIHGRGIRKAADLDEIMGYR